MAEHRSFEALHSLLHIALDAGNVAAISDAVWELWLYFDERTQPEPDGPQLATWAAWMHGVLASPQLMSVALDLLEQQRADAAGGLVTACIMLRLAPTDFQHRAVHLFSLVFVQSELGPPLDSSSVPADPSRSSAISTCSIYDGLMRASMAFAHDPNLALRGDSRIMALIDSLHPQQPAVRLWLANPLAVVAALLRRRAVHGHAHAERTLVVAHQLAYAIIDWCDRHRGADPTLRIGKPRGEDLGRLAATGDTNVSGR
jgi:hypothetical protein